MSTQTLMKPLAVLIGMIILFSGYDLMTSAINSWFLLTQDAGIIEGTRVDRVVASDATSATDAWYKAPLTEGSAATDTAANTYFKLKPDGAGCQLSGGAFTAAAVAKGYTQAGQEVALVFATDKVTVANCKWGEAAGLWDKGGFKQLIQLIFQGAGLGLPLGVLFLLSSFASAFGTKMGASPLLAVVVLVMIFVLVGTLVNTLTPFVDNVLDALSADRYAMYSSGLGNLAAVIGNFYGVSLAAGLLYIGWMALSHFRSGGGNAQGMLTGGRSM